MKKEFLGRGGCGSPVFSLDIASKVNVNAKKVIHTNGRRAPGMRWEERDRSGRGSSLSFNPGGSGLNSCSVW